MLLNADYNAAQVRFAQSRTHNFYAFCNGKVETYYLEKNLDMQQQINAKDETEKTLKVELKRTTCTKNT